MSKATGTVVGYDDFLPRGQSPDNHEFHIVVELQRTGRRMRLRGPSFVSIPLRLHHFGGATVGEVRERFLPGALIDFEYMSPWDEHRNDPNFHEFDVIATNPPQITRDYGASLVRGQVIDFRTGKVLDG
jgi:hypothetical protein